MKMTRCTPKNFLSKEAAEIVSKGYSLEEGTPWTVIERLFSPLSHKIYKPCRVDDYDSDSKKYGWIISE